MTHPDHSAPPAASHREAAPRKDFIREMVADDVATNRFGRSIHTRFPPEPNGFPHIGHVKSICLNFGIASEFGGPLQPALRRHQPDHRGHHATSTRSRTTCGGSASSGTRSCYASDYFEQLYEFGELLVEKGKAYVDSQSEEEIRDEARHGDRAGHEQPVSRPHGRRESRPARAACGPASFPTARTCSAPRSTWRIPTCSCAIRCCCGSGTRITTGRATTWCLYPLYDFAHPLSDAIEGITHSLCTLEFKDNNDIYDWLVREAGFERPPEQTEFSRLELDYTVLSKRKLLRLVNEGHVSGWDDPRMPTIAGMRRRGVTPEALRDVRRDGAACRASRAHRARHVRARRARRPQHAGAARDVRRESAQGRDHQLSGGPGRGARRVVLSARRAARPARGTVPFSRELYIERDDFMEDPPKKFFRLAPGREVRLRYGYFITCTDVVKDAAGEVVELRCTYDPATRGGDSPDGRKVQGTIHWVSAAHALDCELRLYDRLFTVPGSRRGATRAQDFVERRSIRSRSSSYRAPRSSRAWRRDPAGTRYQFERTGYFVSDPVDSRPGALVFNRTVTLRDSWAKIKDR